MLSRGWGPSAYYPANGAPKTSAENTRTLCGTYSIFGYRVISNPSGAVNTHTHTQRPTHYLNYLPKNAHSLNSKENLILWASDKQLNMDTSERKQYLIIRSTVCLEPEN